MVERKKEKKIFIIKYLIRIGLVRFGSYRTKDGCEKSKVSVLEEKDFFTFFFLLLLIVLYSLVAPGRFGGHQKE